MNRFLKLVKPITPSQGWLSFLLLLAMLAAVAYPVSEASWVDTPGLINVIIWSAAAGLLLAKVRAPAPLLHLAGLALGFIVVVWQVSSLIENEPPVDQVRALWNRLDTWYEAARSGGINTDLLPFSLGILALGWILGYLSSWFVFRRSNVWVAVLLAGATSISSLSFLATRFESRFFLFVLCALLLVVWMNMVQRHEGWRRSGLGFSRSSGWHTMHAAVWFGLLVVLVAAELPLNSARSGPLTEIWKLGRSPMRQMEDEFSRMFAGLPSRKDFDGRFFGKTLPFLDKVSFDEEVLFWARSDYPSYWVAQTYSEYTPRGWIAGETSSLDVGQNTLTPEEGESLRRESMDQALRHVYSTSDLLVGGAVSWASRDAVMEVLAPKQFKIDLLDSSDYSELPEDVRAIAVDLIENLYPLPQGEYVDSYISKRLPSDLVLVSMTPGVGDAGQPPIVKVRLERKEPIAPEVASWKLTKEIAEDEGYSMVSMVSVATDDELRGSGTEYSGFMRDHYLQLPADAPQRVHQLARDLTQDAETAFDKAIAVQDYLRGPDFTYSRRSETPPRDADGVDHFLFETRAGYSAYFASSMAVLLRSVGVPTRVAAGYAPGLYDRESGVTVVRDSDGHGWAQVFFPGYGWIDFEPTARFDVPVRTPYAAAADEISGLAAGSDVEGRDIELDSSPEEGDLPPFLDDVEELAVDSSLISQRVVRSLLVAVGAVVALSLALAFIWNRGLYGITPVERAYAKMSRLGTLAGIERGAHQTPAGYAATLGAALPAIASSAQRIAYAFSSGRYGRGYELPQEDGGELDRAWLRLRGSLLGRALGRLNPIGQPETASSR